MARDGVIYAGAPRNGSCTDRALFRRRACRSVSDTARPIVARHGRKRGQEADNSERGQPRWITPLGFAALGFLSASLGLQGIIGKVIYTKSRGRS